MLTDPGRPVGGPQAGTNALPPAQLVLQRLRLTVGISVRSVEHVAHLALSQGVYLCRVALLMCGATVVQVRSRERLVIVAISLEEQPVWLVACLDATGNPVHSGTYRLFHRHRRNLGHGATVTVME